MLILRKLGPWQLACDLLPLVSVSWSASGGHRRDFMVGCPLAAAAAAVLSCKVQPDRWIAPHLAVRTLFECCWWTCRVMQPVQLTPFGLLLGYLLSIRVGGPSRLSFRGSGRFTMIGCGLCLGRMLCGWMSLLMLMMSLVHGLSGLVLLRLHLLMLFGFVVDPFLAGVWFLEGRCFVPGCQTWWSQGPEAS